MSEAVVMIVRAIPKPGQTDAVLAYLEELVPIVHEEEGCERYSLHVQDNGDIYFIERWASAADAERHGTTSSILPTLGEKVSPLLEGMPEIIALTPHPVGGPKGSL
jgi:quinol monooxygenase YgiN